MLVRELLKQLQQLSAEELGKPLYFYCLQDYAETDLISIEYMDLHMSDRIDLQGKM